LEIHIALHIYSSKIWKQSLQGKCWRAKAREPNSNCSEGQMRTYKNNAKAALWCWHKNGSTWTLLETAFTSDFLGKVSWLTGKSILAVYMFAYKELVHLLVGRF